MPRWGEVVNIALVWNGNVCEVMVQFPDARDNYAAGRFEVHKGLARPYVCTTYAEQTAVSDYEAATIGAAINFCLYGSVAIGSSQ